MSHEHKQIMSAGALDGVKVLELGGIGPAPFCGMLLADMGADVVIIDRRQDSLPDIQFDLFNRNKRSLRLDLKAPGGAEALFELVEAADMLIDPYRPGVTTRLGIGPERCLERNPRLVYGQMTGWGSYGPLSNAAGHDLNYIALTGALDAIGTTETPVPPINLVGDYGGGAMYLLAGLLAAHIHALKTGNGQVVDASICDGTASLMTGTYAYWQQNLWSTKRGANFLDGSQPYYAVYRCSDGRHISISPIERRFFLELLDKIGIDPEEFPDHRNNSQALALREKLACIFATRTQADWCAVLEGTDACFAPVLTFEEALVHPHNVERGMFAKAGGVIQPVPAPRFSSTPSTIRSAPPQPGADTMDCLKDWGVSESVMVQIQTGCEMG